MSFTYEERDVLMAEIAELRAELAAAKHQAWADKYCLDADTRAIDLLRTELARAEEVNRAWAAENTWLSATLARVRELVRGRWVSVDDLQSALDGNQP